MSRFPGSCSQRSVCVLLVQRCDPGSRCPRVLLTSKMLLSVWAQSRMLFEWRSFFPHYSHVLPARTSGLTALYDIYLQLGPASPGGDTCAIWSLASPLWQPLPLLSSILGPKALKSEDYLVSCPINPYYIRGETCVNLWVLVSSVKILAWVGRGTLKALPTIKEFLAVDGCWGVRWGGHSPLGMWQVTGHIYPNWWLQTYVHTGEVLVLRVLLIAISK